MQDRRFLVVFFIFLFLVLIFSFLFLLKGSQNTATLNNQVGDKIEVSSPRESKNKNIYFIGEFTVNRVVDGDTVHVLDKDDKERIVRLLAVNTPETRNATKREMCLGELAKKYTFKNLQNKKVILWGDKTQPEKDKYSRLLAYVELDNSTTSIYYNESLMQDGMAKVYRATPPAEMYQKYLSIQTKAKLDSIGMWNIGLCK